MLTAGGGSKQISLGTVDMVPMGRRLSKVSEIIKVRGTLLADTAHSRFKRFLFHIQSP